MDQLTFVIHCWGTAGSTLVVDHSLARPGENKRDVSPMTGWLVGVVVHVNKMRSE